MMIVFACEANFKTSFLIMSLWQRLLGYFFIFPHIGWAVFSDCICVYILTYIYYESDIYYLNTGIKVFWETASYSLKSTRLLCIIRIVELAIKWDLYRLYLHFLLRLATDKCGDIF